MVAQEPASGNPSGSVAGPSTFRTRTGSATSPEGESLGRGRPVAETTRSVGPTPPRPDTLTLIPEAIPEALRGHPQFLCWKWVLRPGKYGPVWTKPPLRARDLGQARSTDARDWSSYRDSLRRYEAGQVDGIGFYPDPQSRVVFGDVDDCRDPESRKIAAWARPLLARFAFSYQEVSPSGTGVKILLLGAVPGKERRWRLDPTNPLAYVEW